MQKNEGLFLLIAANMSPVQHSSEPSSLKTENKPAVISLSHRLLTNDLQHVGSDEGFSTSQANFFHPLLDEEAGQFENL